MKYLAVGRFRLYWRWSTWCVWRWRQNAANGYVRYFGPLSIFHLTEIIPWLEFDDYPSKPKS